MPFLQPGLYVGFLVLFALISLYSLTYLTVSPRESVFVFRASNPVPSSVPLNEETFEIEKDNPFYEIPPNASLLDSNTFQNYLSLCEAHGKRELLPPITQRTNQRTNPKLKEILIQNATIYDGLGNLLENYDIHVKNGLIYRLGKELHYSKDRNPSIEIINVQGRYVTPGIVDMHSHAGLSSAPYFSATEETNEMDQPIHPELRSIDGFNIYDSALPHILAGGVTSTLIIPGSGNLIGGEGYVFKTPVPHSNRVNDMLIQADLTPENAMKTGAPYRRWMKMACGENPKRVYGLGKNKSPYTRMSNADSMREAFTEASKIKALQDEWCLIARHLKPLRSNKREDASFRFVNSRRHEPEISRYYIHPKGHYPSSNKWDTLVALLRGHVGLHWHCYLSADAETQLRITDQFNVSVKAFHHALDLHRAIPMLKSHNIGVAVFADHWAYKPEAYTASVHAPKLFWKEGVPLAFKSDHPVFDARYLPYESSKSIQYGLTPQEWIRSITSIPATLLDLHHRIGSIQVGMDADIVLWNAPPMAIGARPTDVYVDGNLTFQEKLPSFVPNKPIFEIWNKLSAVKGNYLLLKNAQIVLEDSVEQNMQLLISPEGIIDCINTLCPSESNTTVVYDLRRAIITPPLISTGTNLGFVEINGEPVTMEPAGFSHDVWTNASNGWLAGGKVEYVSANQGVLFSISSPPTRDEPNHLHFSITDLFALNKTVPTPLLSHVAIYVSACTGSFAEYLALLQLALPKIASYDLPFVIRAENANRLSSLLSFKNQNAPAMAWIIQGASEADMVLDQLKNTPNVTLLLTTSRCAPYTWKARRCTINLIPTLKKHNIPFILSTPSESVSDVRNLRFEAGWARRLAGMSFLEMVNLVTVDILRAFKLKQRFTPIQASTTARFLIWNGDFGEVDTQLMYVIDGTTPEIVHIPKQL